MTAEIRVNQIKSRSGINTLDFTGNGFSFLTNVGFGTTNATSGLTVDGTALITGVSTFSNDVNIGVGGTTAFFDVSTGNVGIGTDNPQAKLDVNSDIKINDITVGRGGGDVSTNTVLGYQALESNTTGQYNVATGYQALYTNNGGSYNNQGSRNPLVHLTYQHQLLLQQSYYNQGSRNPLVRQVNLHSDLIGARS